MISMALTFMVIEVANAPNKEHPRRTPNPGKDLYPRIGVYFSVNDLVYLHRGGRINTAKRLLGSALNLKPILMIRGGN